MQVVLSQHDYDTGIRLAKVWQDDAERRGLGGEYPPPSQSECLRANTTGMLGEIAFRRLFGDSGFPVLNQFKGQPDALGCEVRTTGLETGCLIIRDNDPIDRPYVLMVGKDRMYRCAGFMWGWKRMCFHKSPAINNRPPAWFISQLVLTKPEHLKFIIAEAIHAQTASK